MDVAEMITDIRAHGFSNTTDFTDAQIAEIINDVHHDICSRERWPFLENSSDSITITSGSADITEPTRLSKVLSFIIPSIPMVLVPETVDFIEKTFGGSITTAGTPQFYYFLGTQVKIFPIPDANYTGRMRYIEYPADLTSATTEANVPLPARHHRLLVLGALIHIYNLNDDIIASRAIETQFEKRYNMMRFDLHTRQFDMPNRIYSIYGD